MVSAIVIFQSAIALSTISIAGSAKSIASMKLAPRGLAAAGKVSRDDQGDLSLHFRLDQSRHHRGRAVDKLHVIEQRAEIRLINAKLALNRLRSKSDLPPGKRAARSASRAFALSVAAA